MWITLSKNDQRYRRASTLRLSVEKRGLSIRLNDEIAEAMQWSHGTRLGVKLGTEEDQGKLALYADPEGWRLQHAGSSSKKLRLMLGGAPIPDIPARLPAADAAYQIDLDAKQVIVTLPWRKPAAVMSDATLVTAVRAAQIRAAQNLDRRVGEKIAASSPFPRQDITMADVTRVTPALPPPADPAPPPIATSIGDVITYLRRQDDVVVKSSKEGEWHVNNRYHLSAEQLVERANRIRKRKREPEMRIA